jgi:hypothetical protein
LTSVTLGRPLQDIRERRLPFLARHRFLALGRRARLFGHRHPGLLRQIAHGVDKPHAVLLDQETDGIAMHAAAKTVVGLPRRADGEAR